MTHKDLDTVMNELFGLPKDEELEIKYDGKVMKIMDMDEAMVKKILCDSIKKELVHRHMIQVLVTHFGPEDPSSDPSLASFVPGPGPSSPQ